MQREWKASYQHKQTAGQKAATEKKQTAKPEPPVSQQSKLCPAFGRCGGCTLLNLSYEEQLANKQKRVTELLKPFGKLDPIIGMKGSPWHYRNKVHWAFGTDRKGKIIAGTYEESTHRIVPINSCKLENETANRILCTIRDLMPSFHLTAYNENTGRGFLRHVLIRTAHQTGQVMVVLVVATKVFPGKNNFIRVLREKHPEITTIVLNYNDKFTSMVLGEQNTVLWGKGYIEDELCGKWFRISPHSFYQINSVQTEVLYGTAIELAGLTGKERVIDAYCGVGTITLAMASAAGKVIGVEVIPQAVEDAKDNAMRNGIENAEFFCGDAGAAALELEKQGVIPDVVVVDPPRKGLNADTIEALHRMQPRRIVYVSCDPATLARDVALLKERGYTLKNAMAADLFPRCAHVESVVTLIRNS